MIPHRTVRVWAAFVIIITLAAAVTVLAVGWMHTDHTVTSNQRKSDQRWCTLLHQINFPRTTAAGVQFNAALTELEREFGCRG
jgi:hypothetical protein